MTPREKATELVKNYYQEFIKDYQVLACMPDEIRDSIYKKRETFAKKCALIAVHEIIKLNINDRAFISEDKENNTIVYSTYNEYWSEVLIEISKL